MIAPDIAPAPTPDLADAAIVRRIDPWDVRIILWGHEEGMRPEAIVRRLPALSLADVYTVIGYALRHPEEMEDYLCSVMEMEELVYIDVAPSALGGKTARRGSAPAETRRSGRNSTATRKTSRKRLRLPAAMPTLIVAGMLGFALLYRLHRSEAHSATSGVSGRPERVKSRLRSVVSCAVAFKNLMADALFYFSLLRFTLSAFGVEIPNYLDAFR